MDFLNPNVVSPDRRGATQRNDCAFTLMHQDFNVGPSDALIATPHGFHRCFLGSPAGCEMLVGIGCPQAVLNFIGGVHPRQKLFAMGLEHLDNTDAFDNFRSDTKNRHRTDNLHEQ